jgi:predicted RNA-binding protein with RPS1 domain
MPEARSALVIGVGTYQDPRLSDLRAPAVDTERLAAVLRDPRVGEFAVETVIDPDESRMRRDIGRFYHACGRDDVLLLHLSCHGVKDERGDLLFAPSDYQLDAPYTAIAANWLSEQMSRSPSRRTLLMLDCCFSGKFPFGTQARSTKEVHVKEHFQGKGRAVITASNAMEYAYEGDHRSGDGHPSMFTGTVIEALQTGRADRDQDGWISVDELYDYVFDRLHEQGAKQTPNKYIALEGPLYVARSSYVQPVEPAQLDPGVASGLANPVAMIRLGAVAALQELLMHGNRAEALAARQALEDMQDDDSIKVRAAVGTALTLLSETSRELPNSVRVTASTEQAHLEEAWKQIEAAAKSGESIEGTVVEATKGGLIIDLGVRGFLPASLLDIRGANPYEYDVGTKVETKVIELDRSRNSVVLSRRAVLEEERKEMRQQILDRLQPGLVVEGQISNVLDFGAFVDLGGIDGLIHISELSWSHVNHPSEILAIGDTVKVKVLDIDRERQRISLGLKQTQEDPLRRVVDIYNAGDELEGKVTKVVTFGAFVEILDGVEGFVHISELADNVESPHDIVKPGDEIRVKILEIDFERRRLSLSAKRAQEQIALPRTQR